MRGGESARGVGRNVDRDRSGFAEAPAAVFFDDERDRERFFRSPGRDPAGEAVAERPDGGVLDGGGFPGGREAFP